MHEALDGLQGVYCIAEDILVVGQDDTKDEADKNHDVHIHALMNRAGQRDLTFNPKKVQALQYHLHGPRYL